MENTSENAANYWYSNPRMNLTDLLVNYANACGCATPQEIAEAAAYDKIYHESLKDNK